MSAAKEEQSAGDWWANAIGIVVLIVIAIGFIFSHWYIFLPLFALAGGAYAAYAYYASNAYHVKVAWQEAKPRYDELRSRYGEVTLCPPSKIRNVTQRFLELDGAGATEASAKWYLDTVEDMYRKDYKGASFPDFPPLEQTRDAWHLASVIEDAQSVFDNAGMEVARADLTMKLITDMAAQPWEFAQSQEQRGAFLVRVCNAVPDIRDMITSMSAYLFLPKYWDAGVGEWLRGKYLSNLRDAASRSHGKHDEDENVVPDEFVGSAQEVAEAYLGGMPFLEIFASPIPWNIPAHVRFGHQWLIALPGSGKTTALKAQILEDLRLVERGKASVVIIDSQGENRQSLFRQVARLECFAAGQTLHDRLVLLEPDEDYPLALNPFHMGSEPLSTREERRFKRSVADMIKMSLASMNRPQDDMLSFVVELVLLLPEPTLDDVVELLTPGGIKKYKDHLANADVSVQRYFAATFDNPNSTATKAAVFSRLSGMLRVPAFRNMFMSETRRFSLASEIEQGKVILVNTDKDLIGKFGSQFFGRFIIALLHQASQHRMDTDIPVFCYIDECHEYIADDENVSEMADQVRKRNIGLVFAHQRMAQITSGAVQDALANMSIRMVGKAETDAKYLSGVVRIKEPETLQRQPQYSFTTFVSDGQMERGIQVHVDPHGVRSHPFMTDAQYAAVQSEMRKLYCHRAGTSIVDYDADHRKQVAVVVPLWTRIERTAIVRGAGDEKGNLVFGKLAALLSPEQIDTFHALRLARNQVVHHFINVPDLTAWEQQARAVHAALMSGPEPPANGLPLSPTI